MMVIVTACEVSWAHWWSAANMAVAAAAGWQRHCASHTFPHSGLWAVGVLLIFVCCVNIIVIIGNTLVLEQLQYFVCY